MEKKKVIIPVLSVLLILALIIGITYALEIFQDSSANNTINLGKISMSYTESSNVINITNALPMTDTDGKKQTNYFDFTIMSNATTNEDDTTGVAIPYDLIIAPKPVDSTMATLSAENIKVYLTKVENGIEKEVLDSTKISDLTGIETNYKLYHTVNRHKGNSSSITTKYRLRAWIDYNVDASNWDDAYATTSQYKFAINVNSTAEEGVTNLDKSGANEPVPTANMIGVYFDETNKVWKKADELNGDANNKWYDYDAKMWANAVTVTSTKQETYKNAATGTAIPLTDIDTMWVWIPRYKYTYFASNTPTEINITFERGIKSTGTITCTDVMSSKTQECDDSKYGSLMQGQSTYTHPAFTFGDTELTGIWISKFEASGGATPKIKPGQKATTMINVSTAFEYSRKMELANNIYGFPQTGTSYNVTGEITSDSNNFDIHTLKNTEWGVATYLSHSKYGTCTNGTCQTVSPNTNTSSYTGGGTSNSYVTNKTQSTTRNIYGIYDMAGGRDEYTMGNMADPSGNFYPEEYNNGTRLNVWTSTKKPQDKYYDKYLYGTSGNDYTRGRLGDATTEMQPTGSQGNWYGTWSDFLTKLENQEGYMGDASWFTRGGFADLGSEASIFCFNAGASTPEFDMIGYRTALAVNPN